MKILIALLGVCAFGANVTITGTYTQQSCDVTAVAQYNWYTAEGKRMLAGQTFRFRVIAGVLTNAALEANVGASPANTSYRVTYSCVPSGRQPEVWIIPASGPVDISEVIQPGAAPTPGLAIIPSQITLTSTGDLIYRDSDGVTKRLAIGSTGQVLTVSGGKPAWSASSCPTCVVTSGSYSDPSWLTAVAGSKVSGSISGNAATATALASNPTDCSANQFASAIAANGDLTCSIPPGNASATGTLEGPGMTGTGLDTPTQAYPYGTLSTPVTSTNPSITWGRIHSGTYTSGLGNWTFYGLNVGPSGGAPGGNAMENVTISTRQDDNPGDLVGLYNRVVMSEGTGTGSTVHGTGWAYVGSCQKTNQYDKCSAVEINADNQSGVDAPAEYSGNGLMNGVAIVGYGTAKNSQAVYIGSGDGATSAWQRGIDFSNGSVAPGGSAIVLPNNVAISGRDTTTGTAPLLWRDATNDTVINATTGYLYFAIGGSAVAHFDNAGYYYPPALSYATLGSPTDGTLAYCSDCGVSAGSCTAAGSGALAYRLDGAWKCSDGSGGGGGATTFSDLTSSKVTVAGAVATMAAGKVAANGTPYTFASAATITKDSGTDSGTFYLGYDSSGQRVCYAGTGITIGNYTVSSGFQGSTCTAGDPPTYGFAQSATVEVVSGTLQTPVDTRADAHVEEINCGTGLTSSGNGCAADSTALVQKFSGAGVPGNIAGSAFGDLYTNTTPSPDDLYECQSAGGCASGGTWSQINGSAGGSITTYDTYANCSAWTATSNRVCMTTDSVYEFWDDASVIRPRWKGAWITLPPAVAGWTNVNTVTASDLSTGGVSVSVAAASGDSIKGLFRSWPAGNKATVRLNVALADSYNSCGLAVSDGTGFAVMTASVSSGLARLGVAEYSNATTFAGNAIDVARLPGEDIWMQVELSGGNHIWRWSPDGITWNQLLSMTPYLTATTVGVTCNSASATYGAAAVIRSWAE